MLVNSRRIKYFGFLDDPCANFFVTINLSTLVSWWVRETSTSVPSTWSLTFLHVTQPKPQLHMPITFAYLHSIQLPLHFIFSMVVLVFQFLLCWLNLHRNLNVCKDICWALWNVKFHLWYRRPESSADRTAAQGEKKCKQHWWWNQGMRTVQTQSCHYGLEFLREFDFHRIVKMELLHKSRVFSSHA